MSTIVTFAGHLAQDPELLHTRDDKPFVSCRVLVNNRIRVAGEWVDGEPTAHQVKVYGRAAINVYDSTGRGDRVLVHGLIKTEAWNDRDTGVKRTKAVVDVSDQFGEVGASLTFTAARLERHRNATAAQSPRTPGEPPSAAPAGVGGSDVAPTAG